ncbi:HAD family hydrolase [Streptomyces sp. NBC_00490]|uniref:HAD hydrolase-like protein n=1 Tax=Streptomyces sp. NBC_00490 TaxID=2903657 RepID=UPI002E188527
MIPRRLSALLAARGVIDAMAAVVLSVDVGRRKPHPDIYRAAMRQLTLHREKPDG